MRLALCSSLQGSPEEFSPDTPVDCYRLAGRVYNLLADLYPDIELELFNRDDFPSQGDAYIAMRNAVVAWGADVAVHVHQDAGGDARGWHVIYHNGEALSLVNEMIYSLSKLPSPMRYGGAVNRDNVAAVKAPLISVLIESGFYSSAEDEAIGIDGWGNAIARGISNYLQHHWGLVPGTKEEEDQMTTYAPRQTKDQGTMHVYVFDDAMIGNGWLCYFNGYNEDFPEGVKFEVYTSLKTPVVKKTIGLQERLSLDLATAVGTNYAGGFAVIVKASAEIPGRLTVLKG
jgi:hypothetical protein